MAFEFALFDANLNSLGRIKVAVPDWNVGDIITRAPGDQLRVLGVTYPDTPEDEGLPHLIVEPA